MILIFSILNNYSELYDLNLKLNIFKINNILQQTQFRYIIFSNELISENNIEIEIIKYDSVISIFENFNKYDFCIEVNLNTNLDLIFNYNKYEYLSGTMLNNTINNYFSAENVDKFKKINKNVNLVRANNFDTFLNFSDTSIKYFNMIGLKKISWFETINFLYKKCIDLNINIDNNSILVLYQIFYPQFIEFILDEISNTEIISQELVSDTIESVSEPIIEIPEPVSEPIVEIPELVSEPIIDIPEPVSEPIIEIPEPVSEPIIEIPEPVSEPIIEIPEPVVELDTLSDITDLNLIRSHDFLYDIWLIKKSDCKILLNNWVLLLNNTYIKKNSVRENKLDPADKVYIRLGKKFKLSYEQNLNHFYKILY